MECLACHDKAYAKELCRRHYSQNKYRSYSRKQKKKFNDKWLKWSRTLRGQFTTSKNKVTHKGVSWKLTFEQFAELRSKPCFYCDGPLPETSIGLDRLVAEEGYSVNNVVPCCRNCNMLKGDMLTLRETLEVLKLIKTMRKGRAW